MGRRHPVTGSGRTDTGVHATGQVAAVSIPDGWDASSLRKSLNALLPRAVWVAEARRVGPDFHPRFDARRRRYEYIVGTADHACSPFRRATCWPLDEEPDPDLLDRTASMIPGERSFRRFAKSGQPERGDRCRVLQSEWSPIPGFGHVYRITADRYLHRMVRYLVGTMVQIATGRRPPSDMHEMLDDPNTVLRTSPPAPSAGLFLAAVDYPGNVWDHYDDRDPTSVRASTTGTAEPRSALEAENVTAPKGPLR